MKDAWQNHHFRQLLRLLKPTLKMENKKQTAPLKVKFRRSSKYNIKNDKKEPDNEKKSKPKNDHDSDNDTNSDTSEDFEIPGRSSKKKPIPKIYTDSDDSDASNSDKDDTPNKTSLDTNKFDNSVTNKDKNKQKMICRVMRNRLGDLNKRWDPNYKDETSAQDNGNDKQETADKHGSKNTSGKDIASEKHGTATKHDKKKQSDIKDNQHDNKAARSKSDKDKKTKKTVTSDHHEHQSEKKVTNLSNHKNKCVTKVTSNHKEHRDDNNVANTNNHKEKNATKGKSVAKTAKTKNNIDYHDNRHHDASISKTANSHQSKTKESKAKHEDRHHDANTSKTTNGHQSKIRESKDQNEDRHHDAITSKTTNGHQSKTKESKAKHEDRHHDANTSKTTNGHQSNTRESKDQNEDRHHDASTFKTTNGHQFKTKESTDHHEDCHYDANTSNTTNGHQSKIKESSNQYEDRHHAASTSKTTNCHQNGNSTMAGACTTNGDHDYTTPSSSKMLTPRKKRIARQFFRHDKIKYIRPEKKEVLQKSFTNEFRSLVEGSRNICTNKDKRSQTTSGKEDAELKGHNADNDHTRMLRKRILTSYIEPGTESDIMTDDNTPIHRPWLTRTTTKNSRYEHDPDFQVTESDLANITTEDESVSVINSRHTSWRKRTKIQATNNQHVAEKEHEPPQKKTRERHSSTSSDSSYDSCPPPLTVNIQATEENAEDTVPQSNSNVSDINRACLDMPSLEPSPSLNNVQSNNVRLNLVIEKPVTPACYTNIAASTISSINLINSDISKTTATNNEHEDENNNASKYEILHNLIECQNIQVVLQQILKENNARKNSSMPSQNLILSRGSREKFENTNLSSSIDLREPKEIHISQDRHNPIANPRNEIRNDLLLPFSQGINNLENRSAKLEKNQKEQTANLFEENLQHGALEKSIQKLPSILRRNVPKVNHQRSVSFNLPAETEQTLSHLNHPIKIQQPMDINAVHSQTLQQISKRQHLSYETEQDQTSQKNTINRGSNCCLPYDDIQNNPVDPRRMPPLSNNTSGEHLVVILPPKSTTTKIETHTSNLPQEKRQRRTAPKRRHSINSAIIHPDQNFVLHHIPPNVINAFQLSLREASGNPPFLMSSQLEKRVRLRSPSNQLNLGTPSNNPQLVIVEQNPDPCLLQKNTLACQQETKLVSNTPPDNIRQQTPGHPQITIVSQLEQSPVRRMPPENTLLTQTEQQLVPHRSPNSTRTETTGNQPNMNPPSSYSQLPSVSQPEQCKNDRMPLQNTLQCQTEQRINRHKPPNSSRTKTLDKQPSIKSPSSYSQLPIVSQPRQSLVHLTPPENTLPSQTEQRLGLHTQPNCTRIETSGKQLSMISHPSYPQIPPVSRPEQSQVHHIQPETTLPSQTEQRLIPHTPANSIEIETPVSQLDQSQIHDMPPETRLPNQTEQRSISHTPPNSTRIETTGNHPSTRPLLGYHNLPIVGQLEHSRLRHMLQENTSTRETIREQLNQTNVRPELRLPPAHQWPRPTMPFPYHVNETEQPTLPIPCPRPDCPICNITLRQEQFPGTFGRTQELNSVHYQLHNNPSYIQNNPINGQIHSINRRHPSNAQTNTVNGHNNFVNREYLPSNEQNHPSNCYTHSSNGQTNSVNVQNHPINDEIHPSNSQNYSSNGQNHPTNGQTHLSNVNDENHTLIGPNSQKHLSTRNEYLIRTYLECMRYLEEANAIQNIQNQNPALVNRFENTPNVIKKFWSLEQANNKNTSSLRSVRGRRKSVGATNQKAYSSTIRADMNGINEHINTPNAALEIREFNTLPVKSVRGRRKSVGGTRDATSKNIHLTVIPETDCKNAHINERNATREYNEKDNITSYYNTPEFKQLAQLRYKKQSQNLSVINQGPCDGEALSYQLVTRDNVSENPFTDTNDINHRPENRRAELLFSRKQLPKGTGDNVSEKLMAGINAIDLRPENGIVEQLVSRKQLPKATKDDILEKPIVDTGDINFRSENEPAEQFLSREQLPRSFKNNESEDTLSGTDNINQRLQNRLTTRFVSREQLPECTRENEPEKSLADINQINLRPENGCTEQLVSKEPLPNSTIDNVPENLSAGTNHINLKQGIAPAEQLVSRQQLLRTAGQSNDEVAVPIMVFSRSLKTYVIKYVSKESLSKLCINNVTVKVPQPTLCDKQPLRDKNRNVPDINPNNGEPSSKITKPNLEKQGNEKNTGQKIAIPPLKHSIQSILNSVNSHHLPVSVNETEIVDTNQNLLVNKSHKDLGQMLINDNSIQTGHKLDVSKSSNCKEDSQTNLRSNTENDVTQSPTLDLNTNNIVTHSFHENVQQVEPNEEFMNKLKYPKVIFLVSENEHCANFLQQKDNQKNVRQIVRESNKKNVQLSSMPVDSNQNLSIPNTSRSCISESHQKEKNTHCSEIVTKRSENIEQLDSVEIHAKQNKPTFVQKNIPATTTDAINNKINNIRQRNTSIIHSSEVNPRRSESFGEPQTISANRCYGEERLDNNETQVTPRSKPTSNSSITNKRDLLQLNTSNCYLMCESYVEPHRVETFTERLEICEEPQTRIRTTPNEPNNGDFIDNKESYDSHTQRNLNNIPFPNQFNVKYLELAAKYWYTTSSRLSIFDRSPKNVFVGSTTNNVPMNITIENHITSRAESSSSEHSTLVEPNSETSNDDSNKTVKEEHLEQTSDSETCTQIRQSEETNSNKVNQSNVLNSECSQNDNCSTNSLDRLSDLWNNLENHRGFSPERDSIGSVSEGTTVLYDNSPYDGWSSEESLPVGDLSSSLSHTGTNRARQHKNTEKNKLGNKEICANRPEPIEELKIESKPTDEGLLNEYEYGQETLDEENEEKFLHSLPQLNELECLFYSPIGTPNAPRPNTTNLMDLLRNAQDRHHLSQLCPDLIDRTQPNHETNALEEQSESTNNSSGSSPFSVEEFIENIRLSDFDNSMLFTINDRPSNDTDSVVHCHHQQLSHNIQDFNFIRGPNPFFNAYREVLSDNNRNYAVPNDGSVEYSSDSSSEIEETMESNGNSSNLYHNYRKQLEKTNLRLKRLIILRDKRFIFVRDNPRLSSRLSSHSSQVVDETPGPSSNNSTDTINSSNDDTIDLCDSDDSLELISETTREEVRCGCPFISMRQFMFLPVFFAQPPVCKIHSPQRDISGWTLRDLPSTSTGIYTREYRNRGYHSNNRMPPPQHSTSSIPIRPQQIIGRRQTMHGENNRNDLADKSMPPPQNRATSIPIHPKKIFKRRHIVQDKNSGNDIPDRSIPPLQYPMSSIPIRPQRIDKRRNIIDKLQDMNLLPLQHPKSLIRDRSTICPQKLGERRHTIRDANMDEIADRSIQPPKQPTTTNQAPPKKNRQRRHTIHYTERDSEVSDGNMHHSQEASTSNQHNIRNKRDALECSQRDAATSHQVQGPSTSAQSSFQQISYGHTIRHSEKASEVSDENMHRPQGASTSDQTLNNSRGNKKDTTECTQRVAATSHHVQGPSISAENSSQQLSNDRKAMQEIKTEDKSQDEGHKLPSIQINPDKSQSIDIAYLSTLPGSPSAVVPNYSLMKQELPLGNPEIISTSQRPDYTSSHFTYLGEKISRVQALSTTANTEWNETGLQYTVSEERYKYYLHILRNFQDKRLYYFYKFVTTLQINAGIQPFSLECFFKLLNNGKLRLYKECFTKAFNNAMKKHHQR